MQLEKAELTEGGIAVNNDGGTQNGSRDLDRTTVQRIDNSI